MDGSLAVAGGVGIAAVLLLLIGVVSVRRGMRRRTLRVTTAAPSTARTLEGSRSGEPLAGAEQQIAIHDFSFQPASVTVPAGSTITWSNRDMAPHTVTFRNGMADSGELSGGQTFRFTFAVPGSFEYYCRIHPHMTGVVVVS